MDKNIQAILATLFQRYEGICSPSSDVGSHVHLNSDAAILTMTFDQDPAGRSAQLTINFLMDQMGVKPASHSLCDCSDPGAVFYQTNVEQLRTLSGYLYYGSAEVMGDLRPEIILDQTPLLVLLGRVYVAFVRDYETKRSCDSNIPNLGILANVLDHIGAAGLDNKQLNQQSILSKRASKVAIKITADAGWLIETKSTESRSPKRLHLTDKGRDAVQAGHSALAQVERHWSTRFGKANMGVMRTSLEAIAKKFVLELPNYLTGYGSSDSSLCGGFSVPAEPGPPRIPAHGQDFTVVIRGEDALRRLPLSALMAKVIAAITIDYEEQSRGWLVTTSLDQGCRLNLQQVPAVESTYS